MARHGAARRGMAQRALHRIAASLVRRAEARSLLTSRTNNACEPTRYAEIRAPKDVTYDTGRSARTVHIFVGDEPLIVAPQHHARSGEGSWLAYESNA